MRIALPEMIGVDGGLTAESFEAMEAFIYQDQDCAGCLEHGRQFHIDRGVDGLIGVFEKILTAGEHLKPVGSYRNVAV